MKQEVRMVRISVLEIRNELWRNSLQPQRASAYLDGDMQEDCLPDGIPSLPINTQEDLDKLEEVLNNKNSRDSLVSTFCFKLLVKYNKSIRSFSRICIFVGNLM